MNKNIKLVICGCLLCLTIILILTDVHIYNTYKQKTEKKDVVAEEPQDDAVVDDLSALDASIQSLLLEHSVDLGYISYSIQDLETGQIISYNVGEVTSDGGMYRLPVCTLITDKINAGEISAQDTISTGDTVEQAIQKAMMDSDNSVLDALIEKLGGWDTFKELCKTYTPHEFDGEYAQQDHSKIYVMTDFLRQIYVNQDLYPALIENMKNADNSRLNTTIRMNSSSEDYTYNAAGASFDGHPYSITIYSKFSDGGSWAMSSINDICFNYFNAE